jgi:hypothetical protein
MIRRKNEGKSLARSLLCHAGARGGSPEFNCMLGAAVELGVDEIVDLGELDCIQMKQEINECGMRISDCGMTSTPSGSAL